jgi:hypothetical protein
MIFRIILSILFLPLIYFYGGNFWDMVKTLSFNNPVHLSFIISFTLSTILFFLFLKDGAYISIFEHELTHNLWAILTLNKPTGFHIEEYKGGLFEYKGRGNFLITLSPYFFLTLSFLVLPLFLFIQPSYFKYFIIILGIFTGFHTSTTLKEIGLKQPDLQAYGLLFSFIVIILGNILCYGIILAFITGSWIEVKEFLIGGVKELYNFIIYIPNLLR